MKPRLLAATGFLVVFVGALFWWWKKPIPLGPTDTLLLGEIANASDNQVFDGTLREALRVALQQSPNLNLVSDEKIHAALAAMGKQETALTPELTAALCERMGASAYLAGRISRTSSGYAFDIEVRRWPGGTRIGHRKGEARQADQVIHQLGIAALKLREDLGEQESVRKAYDVPLERATTPFPAALKAYQQARTAIREKGDLEAVPFYKKALDVDSRFAMAHSGLAVSYYNLNQMAQAGEEIREAYEAADRQTFRERLNVKTLYYDLAQGDIEKAIEGYKEYIGAYSHDDVALGNLSSEFFVIGDYEQAAKFAEDALKIDPASAAWYENYSTALLALSRTNDAEKVLREAFSRKLDDAGLHDNLYSVAFVKGDSAAMQEQLRWASGKANGEDSLLAAQSDTEAYYGRLNSARDFTRRAVMSALQSDLKESAAAWTVEAGLREAVFGNSVEAQGNAEAALKLSPESKDVRAMAALIFARSGNEARAQSISDDLRALYVSNTVMQKAWLPVVQSQMAIRAHKYQEALRLLEVVLPYEKGQLVGNLSYSCMIPAYLRGEAQLGAKAPRQAVLEFQKIEANPGLIGNCWAAPLARNAKARALAASGSVVEAKISYQQFFSLWKDADRGISVLQQARVEAAKLH